MLPSITILGRNVPTYGLCAALGLMLFVLLFKREDKHCPGESADVELGFVYGLLGAALGAKLLFLLTGLPALWADRALLFSDTARFWKPMCSPVLCFTGVCTAPFAACCCMEKSRSLRFHASASAAAGFCTGACFRPGGLFLTGCCYGLPHPRLGISFSRSLIAPNGVPLLPVQLYGAGLELLLFICLYRGCRRKSDGYRLLGFYLFLYGLARFGLEFLRGDAYRGFWGPFSTSQWISLPTVFLGIYLLVRVERPALLSERPHRKN